MYVFPGLEVISGTVCRKLDLQVPLILSPRCRFPFLLSFVLLQHGKMSSSGSPSRRKHFVYLFWIDMFLFFLFILFFDLQWKPISYLFANLSGPPNSTSSPCKNFHEALPAALRIVLKTKGLATLPAQQGRCFADIQRKECVCISILSLFPNRNTIHHKKQLLNVRLLYFLDILFFPSFEAINANMSVASAGVGIKFRVEYAANVGDLNYSI